MYAVELHNLSKTYPGGKQAVQNVSLALEPGEVFGFLGPNGVGKTTTVKLLNGMLTPTEGICRVLNADLPPENPVPGRKTKTIAIKRSAYRVYAVKIERDIKIHKYSKK